MSADPSLRRLARTSRRRRSQARDRTCVVCGTSSHLVVRADGTRCYAHLSGEEPRVELDHPAGRANVPGFVMPLHANAHRDATEFRDLTRDWPAAEGRPLVAAAHVLVGLASLLWLLARWLVELTRWLEAHLGPDWHRAAPPFPIGL